MNEKDLFAVSFVLLIALTVALSTFGAEHLFTLKSYSHALNIEKVVKGEQGITMNYPIYYSFVAFVYSRVADFAGTGDFSPSLLITSLKLTSAFLAALTALAAYIALRSFYRSESSAFGSVMLITSISGITIFLSGFVSPASLGFALFLCGLALFTQGWKRKDIRFSAASGLLFAFAIAAWNDIIFAFAALAAGVLGRVAFGFYKEETDNLLLPSGVLAVALGIVGWAFTGLSIPQMVSDPAAEFHLLLLFVPIIALALLIAALKVLGRIEYCEPDMFAFIFGVASVIEGLYSPVCALPGFALLSAFVFEQIGSVIKERRIALAVAGGLGGFAAFVFLLGLFQFSTSALFGAFIGMGVAFAAAMYKGERLSEYVTYSLAAMLAFASFSSAILLAQSQVEPFKGEIAGAIDWVAINTPQDAVIGVVGQNDAYAFLLQRKVVSEGVADWLLSPKGNASRLSALGIDYLLLDSSAFDSIEELKNETNRTAVRMDSFGFIAFRKDETGIVYGFFVSQSGNAAYIPFIEGAGFDPSSYAIIIEASGNTHRVPFARFVLLRDAEGRIVRAIYPYEDYNVNLFNAFFGNVDGLAKVYPELEGAVRVYKVGG